MLSNQEESKARVPNNATYLIFALQTFLLSVHISSSGTFLQILLQKVATVTRYDDTEPWQF